VGVVSLLEGIVVGHQSDTFSEEGREGHVKGTGAYTGLHGGFFFSPCPEELLIELPIFTAICTCPLYLRYMHLSPLSPFISPTAYGSLSSNS
jgi:hypothetical protein